MRTWLHNVAKERLANRPDLLVQFLNPINDYIYETELLVIDTELQLLRACSVYPGIEHARAEKRLIGIVDRFAESRRVKPIPPLEVISKAIKVGPVMTRAALVAECANDWPTLEADLSHASKNGLCQAARAESGRGWHKESALEWARTKGKLTKQQNGVNSVFGLGNLPVRRNRLR